MAPHYVDAWEPSEGDVGTTLLTLFSELAEEVTERLDRVPEKHRVSFFDTLGFGRKPPQPARLPLSVTVADRAGRNVTVPAGAQVKAAGTDGSEQLFEVPSGSAFDATPANLRAVYSLEPDEDGIYGHHGTVEGGVESTTLFGSTGGENLQEHAFYIGDAERLSVGSGSQLTVDIDTDAPPSRLRGQLRWEYFGERTMDGETVEGWHPFPSQTGENDGDHAALDFDPDGSLTETAVNGIESKWIRCLVPPETSKSTRAKLFDVRFGDAPSTAGPSRPVELVARGKAVAPDKLLRNDVPLKLPFRPFGTWPREGNTFYLASTDAFTKLGASVTLEFRGFVPGERVVDREAVQQDTAIVLKTARETADEWVVYGDETVADQNREYDYPADEPVVLVTFKSKLDADWSGWEDVPAGDLFQGVMNRNIKFHAFPVGRLEPAGGAAPHDPELSWEYFDGEGWSNLAAGGREFADGTDQFQHGGAVEFTVPEDLAPTTVAGHEGHWIRVRLVGGDYGKLQTIPKPDEKNPKHFEQVEAFDEPAFSRVRIDYEQGAPPDHTVAENNLDFGRDFAAESVDSYQPFEPVPSDEQALYLGFDGSLTDGPINLLFDLADVAYPATFHPRLRWEYYDEDTGAWQRLDVRDGTDGLTERGIVSLVFPEATTARRTLGQDRHWVRARVTGESFGATDAAEGQERAERPQDGPRGRFVETVPPAGERGRHRPRLRGIYPNAAWVRNRRTIEGELLGSSDGSVEQTFQLGTPPVVAADVWIDELAVRSEASRQELGEEWPDRTELETDADGQPSAFWVRWARQPDLLDSGPDDRHYTLDPIEGTVSFGDGTRGMIPPRGSDNVRATYETGGGKAGNVPAGAVSGFRQSLAFVESVTNPIAGAAGADAEATQAVTDRAARELRDRNRAVAPADIERIAIGASREVARAQCLPGLDPDGRYQPGWVTVLVVPDTAAAKPTPSTTLQETVDEALAEHAPVTLTAVDQLVVRGPSYVSVSVDADLAATGGSISRLEERAREAVRSYLHPLTGGPDGEGWPFGELPCRSDFFELLEGLEGVNHVERLSLRLETSRSRVTVAEGDEDPDTSADALAHAGDQEITATLVDQDGGTA